MFESDYLDTFDRLVAFDAETTGKHTNDHFEPLIETSKASSANDRFGVTMRRSRTDHEGRLRAGSSRSRGSCSSGWCRTSGESRSRSALLIAP